MDTVKLSRKLIPGRRSYGLGKLCKDLDIDNHARHRASGDALATTRLFELLLSLDNNLHDIKTSGVQTPRNKSLVEDLPKKPGVYYFYNADSELIYVGKSINIHDRVLSHLNNNLHKRALEMKDAITDVKYKLTGNDLVALLLESSEIKKHQPFYNRQQRRTFFNYGLYSFTDDSGYINLKITRIVDKLAPLYTYSSLQEGRNHLFNLVENYQLCQKLCGLYETNGACFHYQIHQCNGACIEEETASDYNLRVNESLENYHFDQQNLFIVEQGREEGEKSVIKIEHGKYTGFGFVDEQLFDGNLSRLHECIQQHADNREVRQIINSYLKNRKAESTIPF